jgi:hypothetical protein
VLVPESAVGDATLAMDKRAAQWTADSGDGAGATAALAGDTRVHSTAAAVARFSLAIFFDLNGSHNSSMPRCGTTGG